MSLTDAKMLSLKDQHLAEEAELKAAVVEAKVVEKKAKKIKSTNK